MTIIQITRGFHFKLQVDNQFCQLILKSDTEKITISNIVEQNGKYFLVADNEATKLFRPNNYKYQLLDNTRIINEGEAVVRKNFALADENQSVKTKSEVILQAIEAQLAGVATQGQSSISVGDKSISYMSFSELIQARQFFKKKVAEQKKQFIKGNEGRIIYRWGI